MASEQFSNGPQTTLNGAITSGATTLVMASTAGFPSVPQFRIQIESELLLVTGVSGTTYTVTRGVESTAPASHANGVAVSGVLTAGALGGSSDASAGTPSLRSLGSGAQQACAGNDARLLSGTLPIARGGTNSTSFTSGTLNYFDGTSIASAAVTTYVNSGSSITHLTIAASASTNTPLVIKGAASQSGDLQQWFSSSGTSAPWLFVDSNRSLRYFSPGDGASVNIGKYAGGYGAVSFDQYGSLVTSAAIVGNSNALLLNCWTGGGISFRMQNDVSQGGLDFVGGGMVGINTATPDASLHVQALAGSQIGLIVQPGSSTSVDLLQMRDNGGSVISQFDKNGGWVPASMADSTAANGTVYYSTTQSKLVYKDSGGTVHNLY